MPEVDQLELKARIGHILNRWPAVGLAVGVIRNGGLEFFHGHGFADIASNRPVIEDTVFRIASITKTFTAIAVMQLWEQGLLDLDAPANDYLRAYRLMPAKPSFRAATVRHLLTHTAGIREVLHLSGLLRLRDLGETVRLGRPVPSLAEYYRGGLQIDAEPGTRFTYTDHGFATLGQLVADVSGTVTRPLFSRTHLRPARHERHRSHPIGTGQVTPRHGIRGALQWSQSGHRLRGDHGGRRRRLLHAERHGSLPGGPTRRRHKRARLGPQTGDNGRHV